MPGFLVLLAPHHLPGGQLEAVFNLLKLRGMAGLGIVPHSAGAVLQNIQWTNIVQSTFFPNSELKPCPKSSFSFFFLSYSAPRCTACLKERLHWLQQLEITQTNNILNCSLPKALSVESFDGEVVLKWYIHPHIPRAYSWPLFLCVTKGDVSNPAKFSWFCEFLGF